MRGRAFIALTLLLAAASSLARAADAERGRYLALAGNCGACHTRPGGEPFAGGLAFETPFGTIYSSNITPDAKTGIGRWKAADLRRAMHEGIAADGSHLFPAFPYPSYTKVTDADVDDIYAYLRTLNPVRYVPPDNSILFSMRWALGPWNKLYFRPGRFVPDPDRPAGWNRGAYLVQGLGHCGACHTPRNAQMAELPERALQGGVVTGAVAPGRQRDWFAVRDGRASAAGGNATCASYFNDFINEVAQFGGVMAQSADSARRAGVYPGSLRDLRRRYRLDWSGWDR